MGIGDAVARTFYVLSVISSLLLLVTFWLGLRIGDWNRVNRDFAALQQQLAEQGIRAGDSHVVSPELAEFRREHEPMIARRTTHFLVALLTCLFVLLVNSISITYFIGTGRWCGEVVGPYELEAKYIVRTQQLKRHAFPWSIAGVVAILVTAALGAAADTDRSAEATWALPHYVAAIVTLGVVVWSMLVQGADIRQNTQVIQEVIAEVQQIRRERGLPVEG